MRVVGHMTNRLSGTDSGPGYRAIGVSGGERSMKIGQKDVRHPFALLPPDTLAKLHKLLRVWFCIAATGTNDSCWP